MNKYTVDVLMLSGNSFQTVIEVDQGLDELCKWFVKILSAPGSIQIGDACYRTECIARVRPKPYQRSTF
jgi:hypothetical protein